MKLEVGDLLTIEDKKYMTIDIILFDGAKYLFTNEIVNEEPTDKYVIYKQEDDEVEEITDAKTIELLFPMFSNNIKKLIEKTNMTEKYEIN